MVEGKRLAVCLLVALILHLLLLGLIRSPRKSFPLSTSPLVVQWTSRPSRPIAQVPDGAVEPRSSGKRPGAFSPEDRQIRPKRSSSIASTTSVEISPAASVAVDRQHPAAAELMESARAIIREMAREQAGHRQGNVEPENRPVLVGLDRALRKPKAAEERLVDGLIRITSESGRVYCFQSPPEVARDGPVAMLPVATNCP